MAKQVTYDELVRRIDALRIENDVLRRNEATIKASEAFHRITLENISDTVIITDDRGKIIYACPNASIIFGLSQHQIYEKASVQKLIDGNVCDISELRKSGEISNIEWHIKNSSGQRRFVLITAKSVSIKDGTVLYVMRDITDRKLTEIESGKSLYRFRQLFENAGYYAYLVSAEGKILDVNNTALEILGYTKDELVGKQITAIYAEESIEEAESVFEKWKLSGKIHDVELAIISKKGDKRWIVLNASPVRDDIGYFSHSISIQVDITEEKAKEEELTEKKNELQHYAKRLEEMNTALKVLIDHRDDEMNDLKRHLIGKFKKIVFPYLPVSPEAKTREELSTTVSILENNIREILFGSEALEDGHSDLSPTESRVAFMIKSGKSTKEIAESMCISKRTVYFHRENLRKKLKLSNKTNLKTHLHSLKI